MRSLLPLAVAVLTGPALAQTVTNEIVMYHGDSTLNDWGLYRHLDTDSDGLWLNADELIPFGVDNQTQINFVQDVRYREEGGRNFVYAIATNDMVLRLEDIDGDGRVDGPGEIVEWADTRAGGGFSNTSPDAMDYDPITGGFWVTDDNYSSGPQPGAGIHYYEDSNLDGDANDVGEFVQFVDATVGITVAGTAGPVSIDTGDFEGLMFDSTNGIVIGFAQQDLALYAFQDLNGDGDAMDAGEAWNFLNLVGDVPGLELNADVQGGSLFNPSCPSSSGVGLFASMEVLDFAPGAGPAGEDVYWIMTTAANASCAGAGGHIYRGIDLNGDLDLNDAGEVVHFYDGNLGPLGIPAHYGGTAMDGGYTTRLGTGEVYFFFDLNLDGDAMDAGEQTFIGSDPQSHFVGEITAVPTGAFNQPGLTPPFFVTYGTAGTSSLGGNPSIGNVGTPVIGNSFDVTLTDGIPFSFAILFLGFSDTVWNRPPVINLPYDLVAIGAPGNTLYAAGDFQFTVPTDAAGSAQFTVNVPNNPAFIGTDLYVQWYCVDPLANPRGATMSNAGYTQVE